MSTTNRFLVIDDDPMNNRVCTMSIQRLFPDAEVLAFEDPEKGVDFIKKEYPGKAFKETILLLDLNMPRMDGWEVLKEFELLPPEIQKQFNIYILTSSVSRQDKERAFVNKLVFGFFEKPLTALQIESIFLVKKHKNSFLNPAPSAAKQPDKKEHFSLQPDDREMLDMIIPNFRLNENAGIRNWIRQAHDNKDHKLANVPVNLVSERLAAFLMGNGFANNLSGSPVINAKGMRLKEAGSLRAYEKGGV